MLNLSKLLFSHLQLGTVTILSLQNQMIKLSNPCKEPGRQLVLNKYEYLFYHYLFPWFISVFYHLP